MNSLELSKLLGKKHKNILRDLRLLSIRNNYRLNESFYVNNQNKKIPCYDICNDLMKIILVHYDRNDIISQIDLKYGYKKSSYIRNEFSFGKDIVFNLFSEYKILSQYSVLDGKYFIDWYVPELNIAIEYDEKYHDYNKDDEERQREIEDAIGCRFIRYKE